MKNDSTPKSFFQLSYAEQKKIVDKLADRANEMQRNSTPSEGWESELKYIMHHNSDNRVQYSDSKYQNQLTETVIHNLISQEIAKARQEVYDEMECGWDICLTNAQYERCVEAQVKKAKQEARQEIIKEIFEKVVLSEDQARVIRELEED